MMLWSFLEYEKQVAFCLSFWLPWFPFLGFGNGNANFTIIRLSTDGSKKLADPFSLVPFDLFFNILPAKYRIETKK
jgi:hypothetical protein